MDTLQAINQLTRPRILQNPRSHSQNPHNAEAFAGHGEMVTKAGRFDRTNIRQLKTCEIQHDGTKYYGHVNVDVFRPFFQSEPVK